MRQAARRIVTRAAGLAGGVAGKLAAALAIGLAAACASQVAQAQAHPQAPQLRALFVGDSTAAGTGAGPEHSLAARLARDFPGAQVDNRGRNGARLRDVLAQIEADAGPPPRLLVVMAGGNDILRFASGERIEEDLTRVLQAAHARAPHVVLITPGDLATVPRFGWPASRLYGWRSGIAHEAMSRVARGFPAIHVSMYRAPQDDPFVQDPARYFASDGVHPSAEGYALWYRAMRSAAPLESWLGATANTGD